MKLKYEFVVSKVAGKSVAVAVGDGLEKFGGFIKMNGTGEYIFNMLKKDVTEEEIVSAMKKDFEGASDGEIEESVKDFIENLKKADVLE